MKNKTKKLIRNIIIVVVILSIIIFGYMFLYKSKQYDLSCLRDPVEKLCIDGDFDSVGSVSSTGYYSCCSQYENENSCTKERKLPLKILEECKV